MSAPGARPERPQPNFRQRMEMRLARWYRGADPLADPLRQARRLDLAGLVNKSRMQTYIRAMGLPLPQVYAAAADVSGLDFARLPERLVVKPSHEASARGVLLFDAGIECMSGTEAPTGGARADYVAARYAAEGIARKPGGLILAEEFLQDQDPAYRIPRDFKVFVCAGRARLIQVIDRNLPEDIRGHSFYRRNWDRVERPVKFGPQGPAYPKPDGLPQLVQMADRIAADIGVFYRLDFYMTSRGPVFGEFTSFPAAGRGFTAFGDRLLCRIMDQDPDPF